MQWHTTFKKWQLNHTNVISFCASQLHLFPRCSMFTYCNSYHKVAVASQFCHLMYRNISLKFQSYITFCDVWFLTLYKFLLFKCKNESCKLSLDSSFKIALICFLGSTCRFYRIHVCYFMTYKILKQLHSLHLFVNSALNIKVNNNKLGFKILNFVWQNNQLGNKYT